MSDVYSPTYVSLAPGQQVLVPILGSGTGPDGSVTLDGNITVPWATRAGSTYTLTRDIFPTSLTIRAGVTLVSHGYRVFVGTLDVAGSLNNDSGGAGFYGGGGVPGGVSPLVNALGGAGGVGSNGSPGQAVAPPSDANGGIPRDRTTIVRPSITYAGGGYGASAVPNGAGIVAIFADQVTVESSGSITANGVPVPATVGGSGGGCVFIYTSTSLTNNGVISANGGPASGGATPGRNGNVILTGFAIP